MPVILQYDARTKKLIEIAVHFSLVFLHKIYTILLALKRESEVKTRHHNVKLTHARNDRAVA